MLVLCLKHHPRRYTIINNTQLPFYQLRGIVVVDVAPNGEELNVAYMYWKGKTWYIDDSGTMEDSIPPVNSIGKITHLIYTLSTQSSPTSGSSG